MSALAQAGYAQTRKVTATPRQIEAQIFSQIAAELEAAVAGEEKNVKALAEAVHRNTQLWTIMVSDLSSEQNIYPEDLKSNLIKLGTFSIRHGVRVMSGEGEAESLIEINRSMAAGLRASPAVAA